MSNNCEEYKLDLIEKVRSIPAIWDKNHEQHHNRYVLHKHWKRISSEMGIKEMKVKRVWKTLRREFGNQAKKIQSSGHETLDTANPQWPYYHHLLFLKDQFDFGETGSNATEQDVEVLDNYDELQDNSDYELEEMSDPIPSHTMIPEPLPVPQQENGSFNRYRKRVASQEPRNSPSPVTVPPQASQMRKNGQYSGYRQMMNPAKGSESNQFSLNAKKMRMQGQNQSPSENNDDVDDEFLNSTRFEHGQQRSQRQRPTAAEGINDEDDGFFNSLLPHVRQLHPQQKMMFRLRVQHQLYELLYGPYDPHQSFRYSSALGSAVAVYPANYQQ